MSRIIPLGDRLSVTAQNSGVVKLYGLNGRLLFEKIVREGVSSIKLPEVTGTFIVQLQQSSYVVTEKLVIK